MNLTLKTFLIQAVLVSVSFILGRFWAPVWLWLGALVGVNLMQSAFTGFCPVEKLARASQRKNKS
jgi:hypothetical protein